MKAKHASEARSFTDIPNIGPRMAEDFALLGIGTPQELKGEDPHGLYVRMQEVSGVRQDPCVLDTYIAAVDFMNGASPRPWWSYTKTRKERYPHI